MSRAIDLTDPGEPTVVAAPEEVDGRPYDVFISYSRRDLALAEALEDGLQRLAKPWTARRTIDVIRDLSDLEATPTLWPSIQEKLDRSRYVIFVLSPHAAASYWVNEEVKHWMATVGPSRFFLVLADGSVAWNREQSRFDVSAQNNAVMPALADAIAVEPGWIDLSWTDEVEQPVDLNHAQFRTEVARLQAPVRGIELSDVHGQDLKEHRNAVRRRRSVGTALTLLSIGLAIAAVAAIISRNNAIARAEATEAVALLESDPSGAAAAALRAFEGENSRDHELLLGSASRTSLIDEDRLVGSRPVDVAQLDGDRVAVGTEDGTLVLSRPGGAVVVHGETLTSLIALAGSGNRVVAAEADGAVVVVDFDDNDEAAATARWTPGVTVGGVGIAPDGETIVVTSAEVEPAVRIDSRRGTVTPLWQPTAFDEAHGNVVRQVRFSAGGTHLVTVSADAVVVWDTATWEVIQREPAPGAERNDGWADAAASENGDLVAGTAGGEVMAWRDGDLRWSFPSLDTDIDRGANGARIASLTGRRVAVDSDGRSLGVSLEDGSVIFWDLTNGELGRRALSPGDGSVERVIMDDRQIVTLDERRLRVWSADDSGAAVTRDLSGPSRVVAAGGNLVVAGDVTGLLTAWTATGELIDMADGLGGSVRGLTIDDGRVIAVDEDGGVWAWEPGSAEEPVRLHHVPGVELRGVAVDPNTGEIAVSALSGEVLRWDQAGGRQPPVASHTREARVVRYLDDGMAVTTGSDGHVRLWKVDDEWTLVAEGKVGDRRVFAAAATFDRSSILVSNERNEIGAWSPTTGVITTVTTQRDVVRALAFTDDDRFLVAGGRSGELQLLDGSTFQLLETVETGSPVEGLVWDSGTGTMLSAHQDGGIRWWALDPTGWFEMACTVAGSEIAIESGRATPIGVGCD